MDIFDNYSQISVLVTKRVVHRPNALNDVFIKDVKNFRLHVVVDNVGAVSEAFRLVFVVLRVRGSEDAHSGEARNEMLATWDVKVDLVSDLRRCRIRALMIRLHTLPSAEIGTLLFVHFFIFLFFAATSGNFEIISRIGRIIFIVILAAAGWRCVLLVESRSVNIFSQNVSEIFLEDILHLG